MLDVLELDAVRAPDEDRIGVRRVDDVGDLETAPLRLLDVILSGFDPQAEVVEQRAVALSRVALLEDDRRSPALRLPFAASKPRLGEPLEGRLGSGTRNATWSRS